MQSTEQLALDYLAKSYPKEDWKVDKDFERDELIISFHRPSKRFPRMCDDGTLEMAYIPALRMRSVVSPDGLFEFTPSQWSLTSDIDKMTMIVSMLLTKRNDTKPHEADLFFKEKFELTDDGKKLLSMVASDLIASANREEKRILESV